VQVEGREPGSVGSRTYLNSVSPGYFATLGIPLAAGRDFAFTDRETSPPVAIVNEAFARVYFNGESALGKRVRRSQDEPYSEIVGVVADTKYGSIAEEARPIYYLAYTQRALVSSQIRPVIVQVRTSGDAAAQLQALRRVIESVDPTTFVEVRTMRDATSGEDELRRFGARLFGMIGGVALLLATIGLYGMMAFAVSSRTREIGTRMALGAEAGQILRDVLGHGLRLVAIGVGIGGLAAWLVALALRAGLAGVSPADPISFGGSIAVLVLVGVAAIYLPARRAARLNPVDALRIE
jgi:predicted permease